MAADLLPAVSSDGKAHTDWVTLGLQAQPGLCMRILAFLSGNFACVTESVPAFFRGNTIAQSQ